VSGFDRLPQSAAEIFGDGAAGEEAYGLLTVDVPPPSWIAALTTARDELGCTFFDWLSAVDEPGTGFRVCAHLVRLDGGIRRLLVRTTVPYEAAELPTAVEVFAGAGWHERETHEMFGVGFTGHPGLAPLLLPEEFEGHPLRKDFVLAARVAKAWPGAKEPGESHDGGPRRRQMQPPGVPDPNEWGPLKGQLPPAPARPGRTPRAGAAGGRAAGERPARRSRSVSEGSASQAGGASGTAAAPTTSAAPSTSAAPATPAGEPPRTPGPDAPWEQAGRPPAKPRGKPRAEPPAEPPADSPAAPAAEPPAEPPAVPPAQAQPPADPPAVPPDRDEPPADEGGATP
jgi:NADH:ubiquinone oxidoreductase subunit C